MGFEVIRVSHGVHHCSTEGQMTATANFYCSIHFQGPRFSIEPKPLHQLEIEPLHFGKCANSLCGSQGEIDSTILPMIAVIYYLQDTCTINLYRTRASRQNNKHSREST